MFRKYFEKIFHYFKNYFHRNLEKIDIIFYTLFPFRVHRIQRTDNYRLDVLGILLLAVYRIGDNIYDQQHQCFADIVDGGRVFTILHIVHQCRTLV